MVSFAVQKLLSLTGSHLFVFGFISFRRQVKKKKSVASIYVKDCSLFSSRSFIVHGLTFRQLIHPEFIFVYFVREWSGFILLHVAVLFSQHHLLRRLSFHHFIFLLVSIFDVEILSLNLLILCFKAIYTFSLRFLIFVLMTMMCLGVCFFIFILSGSLWVF